MRKPKPLPPRMSLLALRTVVGLRYVIVDRLTGLWFGETGPLTNGALPLAKRAATAACAAWNALLPQDVLETHPAYAAYVQQQTKQVA